MSAELQAGTGLLQRAGASSGCFRIGEVAANGLTVHVLPLHGDACLYSQNRDSGARLFENLST
jgi:hypothetical protein